VSRTAKGLFGKYIVLGIAFVIIIQALINMTVATGIIPVTGQTLPFLSYGGLSFLFSSCALGVVLNVSAESQKKKQNTMVATNEEENQIEKENTNIEQL
jgi:cell division protein FtsW